MLVKTIPNSIIQELSKIQKEFIWKTHNPNIKHDTLCKMYENAGLKNVDIHVQSSMFTMLMD